jgi:hypothetical protein
MDSVIKKCEELENDAVKNAINIRNLAFIAKHIRFYCKKRINSKKNIDLHLKKIKKDQKDRIIREIVVLKEELSDLLIDYEDLWLKT